MKKWQAYVNYDLYGIPPDAKPLAIADTPSELVTKLGPAITPQLVSEMEATTIDNRTSIEMFYDELPQ